MNDIVPLQQELTRIDGQRVPHDYLRPSEARLVIEATTNDRDHLLLNLMWQTGARISEILLLRPCDIDADASGVTIATLKKRLSLKKRTRTGWVLRDKPVDQTKRAKRVIPLQPVILTEVMAYAYRHQIRPDERFFDITRVRAFQIVSKATTDAGITYKKIHPHLFRHGFAVNYLMCGGLLPNLKTILGHSSILTTMVYLRLTQPDIRQDVDKIRF